MAEDLDRLIPLHPGGTRPPLFCVHAISGSAYAYLKLAQLLGADQPVYGFEAPGFDNNRPPVRSLPELAEEYVATLRAFRPAGEYWLLGWSMGGCVAVEMARRLTVAGAKVSALILVDSRLPQVAPLPAERDIVHRFLRDMMGSSDESPPELTALVGTWPADVDPGAAFSRAQGARMLAEEIDVDLLTSQFAVFRAHLEAYCSFTVSSPYAGPAVHIRADQSLRLGGMNWGQLLPEVSEFTLRGTHHSIWTGHCLASLSEIVRHALDSA